MMVKSFSVEKKRDLVKLTLFCFTPHGKEKIIKILFSFPMLQEFITKLKKNIDKFGEKEIEENISYIG